MKNNKTCYFLMINNDSSGEEGGDSDGSSRYDFFSTSFSPL